MNYLLVQSTAIQLATLPCQPPTQLALLLPWMSAFTQLSAFPGNNGLCKPSAALMFKHGLKLTTRHGFKTISPISMLSSPTFNQEKRLSKVLKIPPMLSLEWNNLKSKPMSPKPKASTLKPLSSFKEPRPALMDLTHSPNSGNQTSILIQSVLEMLSMTSHLLLTLFNKLRAGSTPSTTMVELMPFLVSTSPTKLLEARVLLTSLLVSPTVEMLLFFQFPTMLSQLLLGSLATSSQSSHLSSHNTMLLSLKVLYPYLSAKGLPYQLATTSSQVAALTPTQNKTQLDAQLEIAEV